MKKNKRGLRAKALKQSLRSSELKEFKRIPRFKNEDEERDFWAKADSSEYFDFSKPIDLDLSELKPSTESISLRLPSYLLARIKELANAKDVPYQSLMKIFLAEKVNEALRSGK